ncbi:MAG: aspartyl protease family protein [Pyrinomonadaceae bacterium]
MKHLRRRVEWQRVAAGCLAAFAVCVLLQTSARAVVVDDKTRSRAERALREGEFETAEKLFRSLLAKDPHDKDARLGLSFTLLKERKLQAAYDQAARVLAVDPLSARAHALLGAAVLASGDFRLSIEEFRTALSLKDNESLAIAGLAMVDFYENRLRSSVQGLRRAAAIDSDEPDYVFDLAQASARLELYKEAANAYERFLDIAPKTDADRRARIRGLIDFLRYLGAQSSLYDVGGSSRTAIPFEDVDNCPVLRVRINGSKETLRFLLDTGSGISVISEETAKRLGLRPVARGGLARAVGGGGRFEIVYGFINTLDIGETRISNVPVYIRHFYNDLKPVDGYIGISVITKFLTTVDYEARILTLARTRSGSSSADATPPPGSIEIPIRTTSGGYLSGEVKLDGITRPLNFIVDTGATISVVSEKLAEEEEELSRVEQGERLRVYGAAGIADGVKTLILPRIFFGAQMREKIPAAILDLEPVNETSGFTQNGILGGNFLRQFRVAFDFQRGVVRLEPPVKAAPDLQGAKLVETGTKP